MTDFIRSEIDKEILQTVYKDSLLAHFQNGAEILESIKKKFPTYPSTETFSTEKGILGQLDKSLIEYKKDPKEEIGGFIVFYMTQRDMEYGGIAIEIKSELFPFNGKTKEDVRAYLDTQKAANLEAVFERVPNTTHPGRVYNGTLPAS